MSVETVTGGSAENILNAPNSASMVNIMDMIVLITKIDK